MKFLVAPELIKVRALALFTIECMKKHIVIHFRADMYTSLLLFCLISADLIRQRENPHLSPFLEPVSFYLWSSSSWAQPWVEQYDLGQEWWSWACLLRSWTFRAFHQSRLGWRWIIGFEDSSWRNVLFVHNWSIGGLGFWFGQCDLAFLGLLTTRLVLKCDLHP